MSYKAVMAKLKQHKEAQENFERRVEEVNKEVGAIAGRIQKLDRSLHIKDRFLDWRNRKYWRFPCYQIQD